MLVANFESKYSPSDIIIFISFDIGGKNLIINDLVFIWYRNVYMIITMIHHNFLKVTLCSFCKIMTSHRNTDIFTVIPNKHIGVQKKTYGHPYLIQ
jgi:hypothetical protein